MGTSNASAHSRMISRYERAGLTMMMSAPSFTSNSHSFSASRRLSGVDLIAFAVPKRGGRPGRRTEWSVKSRSIFGRIRHNRHIRKAVFIQTFSNCSYPAIHHIGRGDHIGPGLCVGHSCFCKQRQGGVIFHRIAAQSAAVTVVGVFAQTHVGYHIKIGIGSLNLPNGLLNHSVRVQAEEPRASL